MARVLDKSANDKDGQEIAKYQITKENLLQRCKDRIGRINAEELLAS